jgi:HK97 family phage major capsid protein
MTTEEILDALKAILEAADGRDLTEDEVRSYEDLEKQLATANQSAQIRARQKAYETPVKANLDAIAHVTAAKPDNALERAFSHYLRTGLANQDIVQLRAQSTTDAAGGYMVPPGFRQKLVEVQKAYGGLAAEVETITTDSGNTLEYPSLDDTANSGAITTESSAFTSGADLVFGTVALGAFKYTSLGAGSNLPLRVSVELLQDSAFDVEGLVSRALGTRIARKQASDWCVGTGTTLPFGICHSALTPDETADAPPVIDYDDLLDTEARLDPAYEQNAKWVMNKATWTSIRGLLDGGATGRPLIFDQAASGIAGRPDKQLLGYPVVIDQAMPDVSGGAGRNCVVLGDLREAYVIRKVSNFVVVVDPYTRSANGEVQYVAWERADGNIQNRSAYKVLKA